MVVSSYGIDCLFCGKFSEEYNDLVKKMQINKEIAVYCKRCKTVMYIRKNDFGVPVLTGTFHSKFTKHTLDLCMHYFL